MSICTEAGCHSGGPFGEDRGIHSDLFSCDAYATYNWATVQLLPDQLNHITVCQTNGRDCYGNFQPYQCLTVDQYGNPLTILQDTSLTPPPSTPTQTATNTGTVANTRAITNTPSPTGTATASPSGMPTPISTFTPDPCVDGYEANVLADAPLSYWRQDEASGSNAADGAGTHPGTYSNVAGYHATGALGNATNNYAVDYGAAADNMKATGFSTAISDWSLEFWMKSNDINQLNRYVVDVGGSNQPAIIYGYVAQKLEVFGLGNGCRVAGTQIGITDTAWHHIVYVYKSDVPAHLYTYKDGIQGGADCTLSPRWAATPWGFTFADAIGGGANASVQLDEIAFYTSQLSSARVSAHYAAAGACGTATPTPSQTSSATKTPVPTFAHTPSATPSCAPTNTNTATAAPADTATATSIGTNTPTPTATNTAPTSTPTPTATDTVPTSTPTQTATNTIPTDTPTSAPTVTSSSTPLGDCPPSPLVGCDVAEKVMLGMKRNAGDDTRDRLTFKFIRGTTAREGSEFGNPQTSTTCTLCLYGSGTLLGQAKVGPDGTLWQSMGSDAGFKYKDSAGTQDGIGKVMLKAGHAGEAVAPKVQVTGKGTGLPDVTLPLAEPVQVQVQNSGSGLCFEGQWSGSAEIIKNDPERGLFKARK